jgi:hypothetical protein
MMLNQIDEARDVRRSDCAGLLPAAATEQPVTVASPRIVKAFGNGQWAVE